MKNILVFGASGFLGNALVKELLCQNYNVIAVIAKKEIDPGAKQIMSGIPVKTIECNLQEVKGNLSKLISEKIDTCYCLAWDGLTNDGLNDYSIQVKNIIYLLNLMQEVKILGCNRFIGAGSFTQQELFTKEGQEYVTDKHKYYRSAQQTCLEMGNCLSKELNITFIWPLITNIYGEGEHSPRFVNTLIRNLLKGMSVPTSKGDQLYDFIHIQDTVMAYIKLGQFGKSNRTYRIGSGSPKPLKEFLKIIEDATNSQGKLQYGYFPYNGVYYTKQYYDISELQDDTGYHALISFEEGIHRTIHWIQNEENIHG